MSCGFYIKNGMEKIAKIKMVYRNKDILSTVDSVDGKNGEDEGNDQQEEGQHTASKQTMFKLKKKT